MSYISDSSNVKEKYINPFVPQFTAEKQKDEKSSIHVFNNNLVAAQENQISKKEEARPEYNVDALLKKYKSNPSAILKELGFFDEKEIKELSKMLNKEKDLKAFLEILQKDGLNASDMVSAMKKVAQNPGSGFFKRVGNVIKTAFTEGITEAVQLAKSEKIYYSDKLSENMEEIREKREDFSSDGLANIADRVTQNKDLKEPTMHFVEQEEFAGKKLYTEDDVSTAVEVMYERPREIKNFVANAKELESIKDENGHVKYKGSTIINVDVKMIENKELQPTIMKTAKKLDMNDEFLLGITDNLVINPEMNKALNSFLDCKDKDGNDRFSAKNLFTQSNYMVDKNAETIATYQTNTLDLASHDKLSGDNITSISANITDHPEIKDSVYKQIYNDNYTGDQVTNYASSAANENKNSATSGSNSSGYNSTSHGSNTASNPIANSGSNTKDAISKDILAKAGINLSSGESGYSKQELSRYFYRKFGSSGDMILRKLEDNPAFVEMLKKYGNNKEILSALIKDPTLVNKITRLSASITVDQLGKIVKLCSSTEKTEILLKSIQQFGPQKAIMMAEKTSSSTENKEILTVLNKNTIDSDEKKQQIEKVQDEGKLLKDQVA